MFVFLISANKVNCIPHSAGTSPSFRLSSITTPASVPAPIRSLQNNNNTQSTTERTNTQHSDNPSVCQSPVARTPNPNGTNHNIKTTIVSRKKGEIIINNICCIALRCVTLSYFPVAGAESVAGRRGMLRGEL